MSSGFSLSMHDSVCRHTVQCGGGIAATDDGAVAMRRCLRRRRAAAAALAAAPLFAKSATAATE